MSAPAIAPPPVHLPDLDAAPPQEVLSWAIDRFFPGIAVACSMQDAVVVDMAVRLEPAIEVFFRSVGCAPCTVPGTGREGRWAGTGRLECGLHRAETPGPARSSGRR